MDKKTEKPKACTHESLHFENGGLHIVCSDCGDMWRAVLKPAGVMVNIMARAQGLTHNDKRKNPNKT